MSGASIEARVRDQLEKLRAAGVEHEWIEIDPDFADTARFCERYGYPLETSANTIIVGSKREPRRYAACVVRADTRLDVNRRVKRLLGYGKLSFAPPEETVALTGMQIGGVTLLALPPDLPLYVDRRLLSAEYVILGAGTRSAKIKASPALFEHLDGVEIVDDLALEPPAPSGG